MADAGAPGTGEPSGGGGSGGGKLIAWMVAIATVVSAIAAVLVVLFGDSGLLGPGGTSTQPAQAQPPAATGASPPGSAERATPQQEDSGDPYTEEERRLARRVVGDAKVRDGAITCTSTPDVEQIGGAVATLSCYPVNVHYPVTVIVASFQDDTTLDDFIASEAARIESTTTPGPPLSSNGKFPCPYHNTWGKGTESGNVDIGPYVCSVDSSGYRAVWGFTNDNYNEAYGGEVFAVIASSDDRLALGDWWEKLPV